MDELKGIGHFTVWFSVGFLIFLLVKPSAKAPQIGLTPLALYSPFIPFVLATISVVPYLLFVLNIISHEVALSGIYNAFLFYGVVSQSQLLNVLFRNFEIDALLLASLYAYLVAYYIYLVRRIRAKYAK